MRLIARRSRFDRDPNSFKITWLPALTVMLASMLTLLPLIVVAPVMPPWGFMAFLAWRLIQREVWRPWAGAALGLFDDMYSGQAIGSAIVLWSLTLLALGIVDRWMLWRDYWQDWYLGAAASVTVISAALLIANETGGHTDWAATLPQIILAILFFPAVMRLYAHIDQWRFS